MANDTSPDIIKKTDAIAFIGRVSSFIDVSELDKKHITVITDGENGNYKYIRLTSKGEVIYEMSFVDNKEFDGYSNISGTEYSYRNGSLDGEINTSLYKGIFKNGKFNGKIYVYDLPSSEFSLSTKKKRSVIDECYYTYEDNVLCGESTGEYEGEWRGGKFSGKRHVNEYFEDGIYCNDMYHDYEQIVENQIVAKCSDGYGHMWHREIYLPINGECRIVDDDRCGGHKKLLASFYHKDGKKEGEFVYHIPFHCVESGSAHGPAEEYMVKGIYKDNQIEGNVIHYWKEKPFLEENYHGGCLDGKKIMHSKPNGIQYVSKSISDGEAPYIENYVQGQLDGEQLYFYDQVNGKIKRKDHYKNGVKTESLEYTLNNTLMRKSIYEGGKLSEVIEYASDERILEQTKYLYHSNGKILSVGKNTSGKTTYFRHYDKNGKDDTRLYLAKKKVAERQVEKSEQLREKDIEVKNADGTTRKRTTVKKLNPIMKAWKLHKALREVDSEK